jgi:hypothetical protein
VEEEEEEEEEGGYRRVARERAKTRERKGGEASGRRS